MNIVQKTIQVTVKFVSQGLDKINKQIDGLNKKTNDFTKSTNDTVKSQRDLNKETEKLNKNLKSTQTSTAGASKANRTFASSVGRAINIVSQFTVAMTLVNGVLSLARELTIGAAKRFIEFEANLARVRAVTGASTEDITALAESAEKLALSTLFTSNEIVKLQGVLGKLGFSVEEIINSQEAIANLAQITGESLEETAGLVGNALRAFELSASSAASVTNTFTAAITNSALSQDYLRTSLQYVAPIAAQLGLSVNESASALGVLADSGFTASRAGTGLRMTLLELGKSGESLSETIERLREDNISLTEAQELVGVRGAGSLLTLISNFERFNKILEETADATATVEANLAILSSTQASFSQLGVSISEGILKPLGQFLLDTLYIKGLAIELVGIFDQQASAQLQLADILSQTPELYREALLNTELDAEAREGILDNAMELLSAQGKLNLMERGRYLFSKNSILALLDDEVEKIREQEKLEDRRTKISQEISKSINDRIDSAVGFKDIETTVNSINTELTEKIKEQKELINELKETDDERLKAEETKLEVLVKQQKVLQGTDAFEMGLEQLTTEKQLNKAIDDRKKSIEALQEILNNEKINLDYRVKAYNRLVQKQEELSEIEKKRNEIYGKPKNDDEPLGGVLNMKVRDTDITTVEEFVERYKKIVEDMARASEIGDDIALGKATAELQDLFKTAEELKISGDIVSVYDAMFEEEDRKRGEKHLAESRKRLEKENQELDKITEERKKKAEIDGKELQKLAIEQAQSVANAGIDAAFDATNRRLEAEQAAVDARYSYEEDRLQSLVQSNLITQAEYERKREQLERERIKKTNEIEKKQFESDKARALVDLAINTAIAIASRGFEPIQSSIILAASAIQAGIISSQKFVPVKFEEGGLVNGKSHSQGGVPFKVQGVGGYEMEGGEYIVNKKATAKYLPVLEQLNSYGRVNNSMFKHFAQGGMVGDTLGIGESSRINALLLKRLNQPIRAYVSESELMTKTNERINQKRKSAL